MDIVVHDKIQGIEMLAETLIENCELFTDEDGKTHNILEVEKINIIANSLKKQLQSRFE